MSQGDGIIGALPTVMPVAVVMSCRLDHSNRWVQRLWAADGIVVGAIARRAADQPLRMRADPTQEQYLWGGLELRLYRDQLESYYHNLRGAEPGLFVMTREDAESRPRPCLVSASFDEAGAFMEVNETVHKVPIPPEVYGWLEAYVIAHYAPAPRRKRQRNEWKEAPR